MPNRLFILLLLFALTGCTSIDVMKEEYHILSQAKDVGKQYNDCIRPIKALPQYAFLYEKMALDSKKPITEAELADPETISAANVTLLMDLFSKYQVCDQQLVESAAQLDPDVGAFFVRVLTEEVAFYRDVLATRPTYGDINTRIKHSQEINRAGAKQLGSQFAIKTDIRLKKLKAEQDAAAEANKQQLLSIVATATDVASNVFLVAVEVLAVNQMALAQAQQQYVVANPAYHPITITQTHCNVYGATLSCRQSSF